MIAVAVAVIMAVILLTGGVVAGSDVPGTLEFFGVTVRTTSAQIFLTGAICTWALLAAAWLLAAGIRRSRERGAELALLRGRAPNPNRNPNPNPSPNLNLNLNRMDDGRSSTMLAGLVGRSALPEHGEAPGHSEPSGRREPPRDGGLRGNRELPTRSESSGRREPPGSDDLGGNGKLPRHSEPAGSDERPGRGELPGSGKAVEGSEIPGLDELPGHGGGSGLEKRAVCGSAPECAGAARHEEVPWRGKLAGNGKALKREFLGRRELAGLLGFAARSDRVVAERSSAGSSGERADPRQHPTN